MLLLFLFVCLFFGWLNGLFVFWGCVGVGFRMFNLAVSVVVFFLLHSVPPRFTAIPDRDVRVKGNSVASAVCRAFGFPAPVVQWSRAFAALPQGRATVTNGTLKITSFSAQDVGTYQCKATNKLGSVSALTTFSYDQGKT